MPFRVWPGSLFLLRLVANPLSARNQGGFDLEEIMSACGRSEGKLLGAGFPSLVATGGKCSELMPCMELAGQNLSKVARVGERKQCIVEGYPSRLHGGLGNLYVSDGLPGDVIQVEVRGRFGSEASLTQAIRAALSPLVVDEQGKDMALGGVFNVVEGQVRTHVSPDFERVPFTYYDQEKDEVVRPGFLQFYEGMGPDLTCMSVLWTGDPTNSALHLRPTGEHTHFFSSKGRAEAGHYHHDVSPETIHYKGYFCPAEQVARVAEFYAELKKGED